MSYEDQEKFINYAKKKGFWIAVRDLKIERAEWVRLQKFMREVNP